MPTRLCRYNHINDVLYSRIIHFLFYKDLSYANTNKRYGYSYKTMRSIVKVFEENGQLVPKSRSGVCYPILQDEHIQRLV